jgi:hypothetical protein
VSSIIYWGYSIMHDIQLRIVFLSSSPAWFTLDLYPMLSVTKVSPCFADILFPSEVCLGCLDFLDPRLNPHSIFMTDRRRRQNLRIPIMWPGKIRSHKCVGHF